MGAGKPLTRGCRGAVRNLKHFGKRNARGARDPRKSGSPRFLFGLNSRGSFWGRLRAFFGGRQEAFWRALGGLRESFRRACGSFPQVWGFWEGFLEGSGHAFCLGPGLPSRRLLALFEHTGRLIVMSRVESILARTYLCSSSAGFVCNTLININRCLNSKSLVGRVLSKPCIFLGKLLGLFSLRRKEHHVYYNGRVSRLACNIISQWPFTE